MKGVVLVTGGAGFIGSALLLCLTQRYPKTRFINVDALTYAGRPENLVDLRARANYTEVVADIADAGRIQQLVTSARPSTVIHLAAETHVDRSIASPAAFVRTNVEGTLHLLEACRKIWKPGEGRFHHVSTDEVYGSLGAEGAFSETSPYAPSSPYAASKAASDHLVRAYVKTHGLAATLTHGSNTFGPRQYPEKLVPVLLANALRGRPLPIYGKGVNVRDWLHVDDHCEAILAVIRHGRPGESYNVGGGQERTNLQVVHTVCRLLAEATGRAVGSLTKLITFVADRPGHDLRYALDTSKIRRDCGFAPAVDFESGLRRTIRWYLDQPVRLEEAS